MKRSHLEHKFVEHVPGTLDDGILYVSIRFRIATHKCCCGCGEEVVTNLAPDGWHLTYDGKSVSLSPSIGNWNYPCRSHYWIRNDRVIWAGMMRDQDIALARTRDGFDEDDRNHAGGGFFARLFGRTNQHRNHKKKK